MKPALLLTLCLATVLRAEDPPAAPVFKIAPAGSTASPAQQLVTAALPKYDPDAPKEIKSTGTVNTPNPDAIELPKFTVTQKKRPRLTPDAVITNKGLEQQVGPLDGKLLNKFTLPGWLGGVSAAERAREEQQLKKKEALIMDVNTIAKAVEVTDPAQAKALRDAVSKP